MNDRFLNTLHRRNLGRPPVWLMRQAGRYLPEYSALRQRYSFLEMCHEPDLITEITLMPIRRFGMDAAILFSDILLIFEAFGKKVRFEEGVGPIIENPVRTPDDVAMLPVPQVEETLACVAKGVAQLRAELLVPLIGFCGGPFTLASYLIEGGSSRDLTLTKQWMYRDPQSFHALLQKITDANIALLQMQIKHGAQAIQIFDSWAHVLATGQFREFSLAYLQQIVKALEATGKPTILFCRGSSIFASQLAEAQPAAISLDWNGMLKDQRRRLGPGIALQGNLDPHLLFAPVATIRSEVNDLLQNMKGDPAFILGLGHGVLPHTPLEAVHALVDCAKASAI